jgi:hypothetical protein
MRLQIAAMTLVFSGFLPSAWADSCVNFSGKWLRSSASSTAVYSEIAIAFSQNNLELSITYNSDTRDAFTENYIADGQSRAGDVTYTGTTYVAS